MTSRIVPARVRHFMRDHLPGAGRMHRAYLGWAYSHRPAARMKVFRSFYRETRWCDPQNFERTQAIREALPMLWAELGIRRLADAACGDFFWMSTIVDHLDYYFGGDIVPELVELARERAPAQCEFGVFDFLTDEFPPVDAILSRDVLIMLSDRDVEAALRNVCRSSARYFIATTFPDASPQDITTGGWRPLNLSAPPLSLPEPFRLISERSTLPGLETKSLGVWEIEGVRARLGVPAP